MRKAEIWVHNTLAGILTEDENGYWFEYLPSYLHTANQPIGVPGFSCQDNQVCIIALDL